MARAFSLTECFGVVVILEAVVVAGFVEEELGVAPRSEIGRVLETE
jgi:hypothetical protein